MSVAPVEGVQPSEDETKVAFAETEHEEQLTEP